METDYDYLFKLLIVGNSGVGKSCILLQFVDEQFIESHISTIGVDFKIKTITLNNNVIKLQVWDTAGQERFRTITSSYYRGANGIIVAYDITNKKSFHDVTKWLNEIDRYAINNVIKILVGNKCDLESSREVTYKEGKDLADTAGLKFIEISAKKNINITEMFTIMINEIKKCTDDGTMINLKSKYLLQSKEIDDSCDC